MSILNLQTAITREDALCLRSLTTTARLVAVVHLPEIPVPLVGKLGPWNIGDTITVPEFLAQILVDEMCAVPAHSEPHMRPLEEILRQETATHQLLPWAEAVVSHELRSNLYDRSTSTSLLDTYLALRRRKIHHVALAALNQGFALTTELGPHERCLVGAQLASYIRRASTHICATSGSVTEGLEMLLGNTRNLARHEAWVASQRLEVPELDV